MGAEEGNKKRMWFVCRGNGDQKADSLSILLLWTFITWIQSPISDLQCDAELESHTEHFEILIIADRDYFLFFRLFTCCAWWYDVNGVCFQCRESPSNELKVFYMTFCVTLWSPYTVFYGFDILKLFVFFWVSALRTRFEKEVNLKFLSLCLIMCVLWGSKLSLLNGDMFCDWECQFWFLPCFLVFSLLQCFLYEFYHWVYPLFFIYILSTEMWW